MRSKAGIVLIAASALIILGGIAAMCISSQGAVKISDRTIHLSSGADIKVRFTAPAASNGAEPLVIICHGMWSGKEYMDWLSLAVARAGYRAAAPDFPTDSGEKNIPILVDLSKTLVGQGYSNSAGLALTGHSLGAVEALNAAYSLKQVRAIVAIGLYVGGEVNLPSPNVLIMTGMYDRFFPPAERIASIRSFTGGEVSSANTLYGSFADGTARKLVISPVSFHGAEVIDPVIVRETALWLNAVWSRGGDVTVMPIWDGLSHFLAALGVVIAIICLPFLRIRGLCLSRLTRWCYPALSFALALMTVPHFVGGAWAAITVAAACLAMAISPEPSCGADGAEEGLGRFLASAGKAAVFCVLLWLFFALAVIIRDVLPEKDLRLLAAAPSHLFTTLICYPLFFFDAFLRHSSDIHPVQFASALMSIAALSAVEAFRPGTLAVPVKWLRSSMQSLKLQKSSGRVPLWQYGLLALFAVVGVALWAGIISRERPSLTVTSAVLCGLFVDGITYVCLPVLAAILLYRRCAVGRTAPDAVSGAHSGDD